MGFYVSEMCSQNNECANKAISYDLMAPDNEKYQ